MFLPDSTDLSLKCKDSKALSLQTCDLFIFFFKRSLEAISLAEWPLTAADLFISLGAGTSFGRKALRFTPLHRLPAPAFILCMRPLRGQGPVLHSSPLNSSTALCDSKYEHRSNRLHSLISNMNLCGGLTKDQAQTVGQKLESNVSMLNTLFYLLLL